MKDYFMNTKRIGFSVWNENDISYAIELWGSQEVTKYITAAGTMSQEQIYERLKKEIDNYKRFNIQYWPVYYIENSENIGCCGLRPYDGENNILEMGIHLKQKYWGQGLAQESCCAVIEYAFEKLGVNALFAGHNPKNQASAKMLMKLGFKYIKDEFYPPTGLNHPSYLLTKEEYGIKSNKMI